MKKSEKKYVQTPNLSEPRDVIFNFFDSLFYPRFQSICKPAIELMLKINEENPSEFNMFRTFYVNSLKETHLNRYISTFSDYFKIYTQLSQVVVHARINEEEDIDTKIVGSKCFEEVKLYYGQAYESLTSSFVVLACLKNIHSGREYSQFASMDLNKYLKKVDKAKRGNPFADIQEFNVFLDGLDSTLRNGSHHASIWREGEKIFYRSGGTGERREITFSRYLHLCNKLTISLSALFLIETILMD